MKHGKGIFLPLCLAFLLLCGCGERETNENFALPESAANVTQLNGLLSEEIEAGYEYCAPTAGAHRQPLQLADLDGDGEQEVLAFLRNAATEMCRIRIYKSVNGSYEPVLALEGEGSALSAVEHADLNGDGFEELVTAWSCGAELNILYVYDLEGWGGEVLLTDSCSEFLCFDLSGDGRADLLEITLTGKDPGVRMFSFPLPDDSAGLSASLSRGIAECSRVRGCRLEGNTPGLLVESYLGNGELVSDLFSLLDGSLYNITLDQKTGVSRTRRSYAAVGADIDGDRFLEIPIPFDLYSQHQGDHYRYLSWVGFNRYGFSVIKQETYHCNVDGWYLVLPEGWSKNLTVRRDDTVSGERCVILSEVDRYTGAIKDRLQIFTLTGENRRERSGVNGRFMLAEDDTAVYAARILADCTRAEVEQSFRLIYAEWSPDSL